jgi:YVTN family beta-propeller protein
MRREALGAAVAILVVISLGVGYLAGGVRTSTVTSVSTTTSTLFAGTTTVTSTVSLGPPIPASSLETFNATVGEQPRTIGVDVNLDRIYVAYWFADNLTVIDGTTHSVVATIKLPAGSENGIAVDYQTHMVYVSVDGGVVEVNGTTDQIVGELHPALGYGALAYDQATHVIYGSANDTLLGIDVLTGSLVADVSLPHSTDSVTVDPSTNMIIAAGCGAPVSLVCGSVAYLVNGTSRTLTKTVQLGGGSYPRVAVDTYRHMFYVSGDTLAAINDTSGAIVFNVNPQECGPFDSMAFDENTDQLAAISLDFNFVFIYNGATGSLLDMYSLPATPQFIAYNGLTNELYVTVSSQLTAFHNSAGPGYVDTALVGSGENCPLP